jgi:hypothetical protein
MGAGKKSDEKGDANSIRTCFFTFERDILYHYNLSLNPTPTAPKNEEKISFRMKGENIVAFQFRNISKHNQTYLNHREAGEIYGGNSMIIRIKKAIPIERANFSICPSERIKFKIHFREVMEVQERVFVPMELRKFMKI